MVLIPLKGVRWELEDKETETTSSSNVLGLYSVFTQTAP